jgi:hypothetical protein
MMQPGMSEAVIKLINECCDAAPALRPTWQKLYQTIGVLATANPLDPNAATALATARETVGAESVPYKGMTEHVESDGHTYKH